MKIAVVGLGAIGSQVLWQLSRIPELEVHGFDTHYPGHSTAGAGGESRLYWNLELEEPKYAPLIVRARELWRTLEEESGDLLRFPTGVLVLGHKEANQMKQAIASAEDTGAQIDLMSNTRLLDRFPMFQLDPDIIGAWDRDGAVIRPELTVATAARLAKRNGAVIHDFTRVTNVETRGDRIDLSIGKSVTEFDRVIVACGGWTPSLLPYLKDEVVVRRLTSAWFNGVDSTTLSDLPPFLQTAPSYCYGIPTPDQRSVKLGLGFNDHFAAGDPDTFPRQLEGDALDEEIRKFDWIRGEVLPNLSEKPYRLTTYVESYTRSMMEYVRYHPDSKNLIVLTGFSGHGFRVAPAIGEIGAQMAVNGKTAIDVSFLESVAPVFDILDASSGKTTFNSVMSSRRLGGGFSR